MGDCQSSWHTSSHRTTISIRISISSPVEQIIAPGCRALCIMCGIWCFLPTMNLCRKVVFWPVGCNRTDSFLKQRGLLYLHLYNLVAFSAFLAIAKDSKSVVAPTIHSALKWFCTPSESVTMYQCIPTVSKTPWDPPQRFWLCSIIHLSCAYLLFGRGTLEATHYLIQFHFRELRCDNETIYFVLTAWSLATFKTEHICNET